MEQLAQTEGRSESIQELLVEVRGLRAAVKSMQERHVFINQAHEAFHVIAYCHGFLRQVLERPSFPEAEKKKVDHCLKLMGKWARKAELAFPDEVD